MELHQWSFASEEFMPFGNSVASPGWMVKSGCNFGFSVVYSYVYGGVRSTKEEMQKGIQEYLEQL